MTRVKICGITGPADARRAVDLGAWALGMIFWPRPARLPPEEAELIGAELHRRTILTGVFVNATLDEVAELADRCHLGLLQLHGDEGPAYCREAARRTGCKVAKAARVRERRAGAGAQGVRDRSPSAGRPLAARAGRHRGRLRLGSSPVGIRARRRWCSRVG